MISRSLMSCSRLALTRVACRSVNVSAVRSMSGGHDEHVDVMDKKHYPAGLHPASWDDFPVPQGSFKEHNEKLQAKYNRHLLIGLVLLSVSVYYLFTCPQIDFVMAPKSIGVNPPRFSAYAEGQSPRDKK